MEESILEQNQSLYALFESMRGGFFFHPNE
jgi:hypothetical protein